MELQHDGDQLSSTAANSATGSAASTKRKRESLGARLTENPVGKQQVTYIRKDGSTGTLTYRGRMQFVDNETNRWFTYNAGNDELHDIAKTPQEPLEAQPYTAPSQGGFSMRSRANEPTRLNSLLAAAGHAYDEHNDAGSCAPDSTQRMEADFSPAHANPAPRADLAREAARAEGMTGRLSANDAAGNGRTDLEHTHLQGRGIGGSDSASNFAIASSAANTEMIPIESALRGCTTLRARVTFHLQPDTKMIERIEFQVRSTATGQELFVHNINGQQGVFTTEQYDALKVRVKEAIGPARVEFATDANVAEAAESLVELAQRDPTAKRQKS